MVTTYRNISICNKNKQDLTRFPNKTKYLAYRQSNICSFKCNPIFVSFVFKHIHATISDRESSESECSASKPYDLDTVGLTEQHQQKLQVCENICVRRITGTTQKVSHCLVVL